ncbi:hypothetical protein GCM10010399_66940 [Dactylosporangium fulvum]|uniref:Integral membrane protein n=1 Tax=Dactylosporangium fulvum TaxID=53359 RepID=A0ABY5W0Z9_9ACTN|nr:hypothetical protein [Dactylosporangium fulvum]UWP83060.1 hypothetical protein Dfulv_01755 [Dactylosporangium fulvum]
MTAVTDTSAPGSSTPPAEDRAEPDRLRRWFGPLFPDARPTQVTLRGLGLAAAAVVAGTAVGLTRVRGPGAFDSIWAEDGTYFLTDALSMSFVDAVTTSMNGYFHLIPRVFAEVSTFLPVSWAAAVMTTEAAFTSALLAVLVYVASGSHVSSAVIRLLAAAPLVVAPVGQGGVGPNGGSVIDNLATLQFALMYALFWLMLWVPAGRVGRIVAPTVVVLVALTTPLSVMFLPLLAVRLLVRRDSTGLLMTAGLVFGAAVQYGGLALGYSSRGDIGHTRLDPVWVAAEYVRWSIPNALLGETWWRQTLRHTIEHRALVAAAWLLVLAIVAAALLRVTRPMWHVAIAAFGCSLLLTGVELASLGATTDRYLYAPGLLAIAGLAALLPPAGPAWRGPGNVPVVAFATVLVVVCGANVRVDNHRAFARSWTTVVGQARDQCADGTKSKVTISTHASNRYWTATIPCRKLTE